MNPELLEKELMMVLSAAGCWNVGGEGKTNGAAAVKNTTEGEKGIEQDGGSGASAEDEVEAEMKG